LREREGVSREELSNRTALDLSFLKEVEKGKKSISERNLRKIAEALETDVRNLFLKTDRDAALLQRSAMEKVRGAQARVEELGVEDLQLERLLKGALGEMREVLKVIWVAVPISEELEAELEKLTRTARRLARLLLESADEEGGTYPKNCVTHPPPPRQARSAEQRVAAAHSSWHAPSAPPSATSGPAGSPPG